MSDHTVFKNKKEMLQRVTKKKLSNNGFPCSLMSVQSFLSYNCSCYLEGKCTQ